MCVRDKALRIKRMVVGNIKRINKSEKSKIMAITGGKLKENPLLNLCKGTIISARGTAVRTGIDF